MLMYNIALVTNGSPVSYCGVSTSPLIFPSEISPDFAPPIDTVVQIGGHWSELTVARGPRVAGSAHTESDARHC